VVQYQVQLRERLPLACMKTGVLIPDTIRAVTLAAADDYASVSFNKKISLCRRGSTSLSVRSVPSVVTPSDVATPIETEIPIITNATFNIARI